MERNEKKPKEAMMMTDCPYRPVDLLARRLDVHLYISTSRPKASYGVDGGSLRSQGGFLVSEPKQFYLFTLILDMNAID